MVGIFKIITMPTNMDTKVKVDQMSEHALSLGNTFRSQTACLQATVCRLNQAITDLLITNQRPQCIWKTKGIGKTVLEEE
jgi:hypothetical protein